jgi:hypothetical protein
VNLESGRDELTCQPGAATRSHGPYITAITILVSHWVPAVSTSLSVHLQRCAVRAHDFLSLLPTTIGSRSNGSCAWLCTKLRLISFSVKTPQPLLDPTFNGQDWNRESHASRRFAPETSHREVMCTDNVHAL